MADVKRWNEIAAGWCGERAKKYRHEAQQARVTLRRVDAPDPEPPYLAARRLYANTLDAAAALFEQTRADLLDPSMRGGR